MQADVEFTELRCLRPSFLFAVGLRKKTVVAARTRAQVDGELIAEGAAQCFKLIALHGRGGDVNPRLYFVRPSPGIEFRLCGWLVRASCVGAGCETVSLSGMPSMNA